LEECNIGLSHSTVTSILHEAQTEVIDLNKNGLSYKKLVTGIKGIYLINVYYFI
jgi:hypothetical protein